MVVAQVVKRGEMFDDCGYASKWEWVLVNGSWIGLVSWRCEKLEGNLKLSLYMQFD